MARAKKPAKLDKYTKVQPKVHPYTILGIVGFFIVVFGLIFYFPTLKRTIDLSCVYHSDRCEYNIGSY